MDSVESVKLSSPPLSGQLSPASPQTIAWEDLGDWLVPLSPNRVQAGRSEDVPDEGSLFRVSPVSRGFLRGPRQAPLGSIRRLLPTTLDNFSDSVLGDPITYAQCEQILGSDAPMTLPVYTLCLDSTWRGTGDGSSSQPATGRGHYVVQSSVTVAVCDVATSDAVGNVVHRHGTLLGQVVFLAAEVADLSPAPRATRAAKYMTAMGLWRPRTGPGGPGPVLASSCNACMTCWYCFREDQLPPE